MRNFLLGALGALALVGAGVTPAAAQETPTAAAESGGISPELLEIEKNLHPQTGDITIPAAHAVLHLGDDYYYLPADEAKRVLIDVWGNPPSAVSNVLGLVFEKDATIFDNVWGAVISYDNTGHISDANAEHEDYAAVLREMQKGDAADNAARREAGYPTMNLIGWAQPPSYDKASHALIEVAKSKGAQASTFGGLHLPRTTRYLSRYERGLIAFLSRADSAPSLPQAA